jgi:MYXO-CTERM domain-containing protein
MRARHLVAFASCLALLACGDEQRRAGDPAFGQMEQAARICAAGPTVEGLDVSVYQGAIDWDQVAAAGKVFAITRIGDGLGHDSYFATNWAAIQAHGLIRGSYQFFRTGDDPIAQADIVVTAVGTLGPGDLPVTADVEEQSPSLSPADYNTALHRWSDRVEQGTGKRPFIYTGRSYWDSYVGTSDFSDRPLWHAQYTTDTCPDISDHWATWSYWQYRADPYPQYGIPGGTCPGVSGYVDLDVFNGSLDDLKALANVVTNHPPVGYVDAIDCASVRGWAQDPDAPTASIDVHVYFNGGPGDPAATGFPIHADIDRADLCTAIGSCNHGYSLATPLGFQDGQPHVVHVFAIDSAGGNNPELSGSGQTLTCPVPTPPVPAQTGVKRHVLDPQSMTLWNFGTPDVVKLPDAQIDGYTQGPDWLESPKLVQAAGDPAVYVLENKTLRHVVSQDSMASWRFTYAQVQAVTSADLALDITGADLLARPFVVQGSGPAVYVIDNPPPLWAVPISNDAPTALAADQTVDVTFQLQNRGAIAWKPGEVYLAPTSPRDHDSPLCDSGTWKSCQRAVSVSAEVVPGDTASIVVTLRAPSSAGTVSECFNLVYKDSFWFSDVGQMGPRDDAICLSVAVSEPVGGPDAGAIVIPPGEDAGEIVVQPGADAGALAHGDAGKPVVGDGGVHLTGADAGTISVDAGCSCASTSSGAFAPMALALLALARRRRLG